MSAIPRIAPRIPRNSESCSENGLFTPRAFFSKLGWFPGQFLRELAQNHPIMQTSFVETLFVLAKNGLFTPRAFVLKRYLNYVMSRHRLGEGLRGPQITVSEEESQCPSEGREGGERGRGREGRERGREREREMAQERERERVKPSSSEAPG